jgi:hypothetical protein
MDAIWCLVVPALTVCLSARFTRTCCHIPLSKSLRCFVAPLLRSIGHCGMGSSVWFGGGVQSKNSSSNFLISMVSSTLQPISNRIISRVSKGPSTSTIRLLSSSAVSFAAGENADVVTNNPLVALNLSSDPKKSRTPNLQLRVYTGHSYHPKLYIFGDDVALVGSANLTRSALLTNQEVVVSVDSRDDRFVELMAIFEDYWDGAEVPTKAQLTEYRDLFKQFSKLENDVDILAQKVLDRLGDKSPNNINRGKPKDNKQSLFLSNFRRTYQECVSAFDVVRTTYLP